MLGSGGVGLFQGDGLHQVGGEQRVGLKDLLNVRGPQRISIRNCRPESCSAKLLFRLDGAIGLFGLGNVGLGGRDLVPGIRSASLPFMLAFEVPSKLLKASSLRVWDCRFRPS